MALYRQTLPEAKARFPLVMHTQELRVLFFFGVYFLYKYSWETQNSSTMNIVNMNEY